MQSVRATKYEAHRRRKLMTLRYILPRLYEVDKRHADQVAQCGEYVAVALCKRCQTKHYAGHNRCRSRFCIDCAHRRAMIYAARMTEAIMPYVEQGYIPMMLTLTVRDGPSLRERLDFLLQSWRAMTNYDREGRRKYKERMKGGFRTIEVKVGKGSGQWHPHIHALYLAPPDSYEKDFIWLKSVWKSVTGGNGSVEVHQVKDRGAGILKAVCEVIKYCFAIDKATLGYTNDPDRDLRLFEEMYWTLKGRRMFQTWGLLRGIKESELEEQVGRELEDEKKLAQFLCQVCGSTEYEIRSVLADTLENAILLDL